MAATEANAEPVQADIVENKAEVETTNPAPASTEEAPASTEETQPTTEAPQSTEQPADSKSKPASEKIWDSFLNKSGLGKVMGGKKKKEQQTGAEDTTGEEQDKVSSQNDQGDTAGPKDQESSQPAEAGEAAADGQTIEKAPENEEVSQEQKASGAKPKQGEKSSVRDFIRKPVAKIFSHKSTDKKDSTGALQKHGKVRSKSLDRLEDADASTNVADQAEEPPTADEPDKSNPQTTKNMKRWHSFKKLMAQKSHKKSTDESKDAEGAEGTSADGAGDSGTLDSTTKSEHSGQKRWKLKRSWTFQGLKRDSSVVGIHKPKDKDSSDVNDENAPEAEQGTEDVKVASDTEAQEKINAEGEEEKGATATTQHAKSVDQHANEIWTSFKKRVIPKSKRAADTGGVEEEAAGEQEQTDEPQAGKDSGKTAKAKRTHFNRAVSLKNFILRKGKSTSVDMGEGTAAQKDGDGTCESEAKDLDGLDDAAGATDVPQTVSEEQTVAQNESSNEAQVAGEYKSSDGEERSHTSAPSGQPSDKSHVADPAPEGGAQTEPKANGENGCLDATSEYTAAHNHEATTQNDVKGEETNQETIDSSGKTCPKDGKILNQDGNCDTVNAVAQSEKKAGNV
ncbi:myb-like protein X isoform X2 [Sinocyclocheilus grahami]|uniref:Myb-like protein X n=1 Tax=Sinocyclocheilus grahami TaxID=75366 RepID=A0A672R7L9_SINGR|nr:PREDICTED: myb-like protein X isoform X2 [Sinocyclocheilus grahami]